MARTTAGLSALIASMIGAVVGFHSVPAHAFSSAYTDSASFLNDIAAQLPATQVRLDFNFDGAASGTALSSGSGVLADVLTPALPAALYDSLTFTYDFDGVSLGITDGSGFGNPSGPFTTTSPSNFLGTDDADLFGGGDDITLGFHLAGAIGLFVITAEPPDPGCDDGMFLCDGDFQLSAGSQTAALDVSAIEQTLSDGSSVFFLGVIDTNAFTTATLDSQGPGLFNIDDVVVVTPEPSTIQLVVLGLGGLATIGRRRCR